MKEMARKLRFYADCEETRIARWDAKYPNAYRGHEYIFMTERIADLRKAADLLDVSGT